jgi:uncharacterized protein YjlB
LLALTSSCAPAPEGVNKGQGAPPEADEMSEMPAAKVAVYLFEDDGAIPNNPALPFLICEGGLGREGTDPARCESLFAANGWGGAWRNGIFSFPHYHSTAHEVLGVCCGEARVRLGGGAGIETTLRAGDVVVIPAGGGHQNLGSSPDLLVVGAYPAGQEWDVCRGRPDERPRVLENIARVPLPDRDPLHGAEGPLVEHWLRRG